MPEHVNITDPDIHEMKGAASATEGQIPVADGAGSSNWTNPSSILNAADFTVEQVLYGSNTADQEPGAVDTPVQVDFGVAVGGALDPVQLLSDGTIQFNEAGLYDVKAELQVGKVSGGASVSHFIFRPMLNGSALNGTTAVHVNPDGLQQIVLRDFIDASAGDVLTVEFYIDSGGAGSTGGLYGTTPSVGGWNPTPSAAVDVKRFIAN